MLASILANGMIYSPNTIPDPKNRIYSSNIKQLIGYVSL